jgi:hypothetical protein
LEKEVKMPPGAGTTEPLPVELADISAGTLVLILGVFLVIVGIVITGVVYRESREWRKLILPMFNREHTETASESPREPDSLTPRTASFGKEIASRVFSHMDVAGLLGGGATVILGILVVLIGLSIGS